jgi:hypothetical protein
MIYKKYRYINNLILMLVTVLLCSCGLGRSELADKNRQLTESEIIVAINDITGKEPVDNSVEKYRLVDKTSGRYELYDSIVPGIRYIAVEQQRAYDIVEQYFDSVKRSGKYIYMTNISLDESYRPYYDIVIVPETDQFEIIRLSKVEPVNYNLTNLDVVNWFKDKQREFEFDIIVADVDRIEAVISTEPTCYKRLANDIYQFCPDVIDQGHGDMDELIKYLKENRRMWFWWD